MTDAKPGEIPPTTRRSAIALALVGAMWLAAPALGAPGVQPDEQALRAAADFAMSY